MENSRLKNSALNFASGFLGRVLAILLNFAVRTIFIYCLNEAYLSVNGLYSNILTVLSLAELGFGSAMVYRMYAPVAVKDYQKTAALLQFYKKIYIIIGVVIFLLGLCVIPFMDYIIKDKPDISGLTLYYILFLVNTSISYWFSSYKASVLYADQKEYIKTNVQNTMTILQSGLQIVLLLLFRKYLLYLLIQLAGNIFLNLYVAHLVDKRYPEIQTYQGASLSTEERVQIRKDTEALVLSRFGHVALNGTDNIIISAVVGVLWVGRLSNYTLICDSVTSVLCQITAAITGSLGNFFATEDKHAGYALFKKVEFLNFWLYGFSFIALVTLLDPFVQIWAGERFVLGLPISIAIAINFFVAGYMNTLWVFRSTIGLFKQGKFRPILVAILNIILSIFLGKLWGVFGVLFATFLSRAAISLWYDPLILHRYGFEVSCKPFFARYFRRVLLLTAILIVMLTIRYVVLSSATTVLRFAVMTMFTAIVPNAIFWLAYHRCEEYAYFRSIVKDRVIAPIRGKLH
ncbi:MAG: lipopolysaccharide biosynthesis protein [Oscillospiraceae bacterium]|jgi:O-antigen/teichoic acid export membrane protein